MEKSIEKIWKEGFLESNALVAPKLNDLYSQKSQHIVDRFKRLGKRNLYGILIGAIFIFTGSFFIGVPLTGGFIFFLLLMLVWVGRRQSKALEKIDKGTSSYQYLKAFDDWLKNSISEYARIYRFVYPLLFLSFIIILLYSGFYEKIFGGIPIDIIMNDPDTYLILGLPMIWITGILLFLGAIAYFSGVIYKFDLYSVYGRVFKKLEEILTDMEELRN